MAMSEFYQKLSRVLSERLSTGNISESVDVGVESPSERCRRFIQFFCLVLFVFAAAFLVLDLSFSLFVSWRLWSGSTLFTGITLVGAFFTWRMSRTALTYLAGLLNLAILITGITIFYWEGPYFASFLLFLFILALTQSLLGLAETIVAGSFLVSSTVLYSILHHNQFYAPDGQIVIVDYGSLAIWWLLIGGITWLFGYLFNTLKRDNLVLNRQATILKEAQKQLHESEERYKALSEASFEGIAILERDKIIEVNAALARMLGYEVSELVGRPISELFRMDSTLQTEPEATGVGLLPCEKYAFRRDGFEFPVETQSRDFVYRGRQVVVSTFRDITARKETQKALEHSQQQLLQAQKLESIGRLAGGVAHDFNNVLTVILGECELLLFSLEEGSSARSAILEIQTAAMKAASLTRQLLAFSRSQVLKPLIINLNDIVLDMDKLLKRLIGEDIQLSTMLDHALFPVLVDPGQFEQVVMNLAVNARDAMPGGGVLTIETANVYLDENYIAFHKDENIKPGEYVLLAVSDNGVGMDSATQSQIFEPFFTTKEKGKGTGLGLATIYGIVEQSGGYIRVYSTPRFGTTFKIYLPRYTGDSQSAPATIQPNSSPSSLRGTESILVVEDEIVLQQLIRQVLETYGYRVMCAGNGQEALKLLDCSTEKVDLLLTDLVMPEMGGLELLEELRKREPGIRTICMSGYTDRVMIQKGIIELCDSYLQKPFTPGGLVQKIREVL